MAEEKKPFKVTISDEDYLSPDELDALLDVPKAPVRNEAKPKFEVHIEDDEIPAFEEENQPQYNGEIYFSAVKPSKNAQPPRTMSSLKKKKKTSRGALALFLAVLIIFTTAFSAWAISCVNDVVSFGRTDETVTVTIPNDADTNDIINILSDEGLIKQKEFCRLFYQLMFFVKNINKKTKTEPVYLSGVYYVTRDMGFEGYLSEFKEAQKGKDTINVTIPEGWCAYQIFEKLEKYGVCSKSRLISSLSGTDFEYDFAKALSNDSNRTFKLEGYLFPDTYEFYVDSDPNSVLRKMIDQSENIWTDDYQKQADKMGRTRDEIITIASIIQREAANTEQMGLISSVINNRLDHPVSWPTLGCDSTENYINTYVASNVTTSLAYQYLNRYNTYSNKGLPPGPICNPGDDAIKAALYPDNTNYYFFRHDKYGKIYMAVTQSEHDSNANLVLRANSK